MFSLYVQDPIQLTVMWKHSDNQLVDTINK